MKTVLFLATILLAIPALANTSRIECYNMSNGEPLTLQFENGALFSVQIFGPAGMVGPEQLATLVANQGPQGQSVYHLSGTSELLYLDNSVLSGNDGEATLGLDAYNCSTQ